MLVTRVRAFAAAFIVVLVVGLGSAGVVATAAARTPAAHHKSGKKAHRKAATHKRTRRHDKRRKHRRKHVKRAHTTAVKTATKKKRGGGGTGGTGGTGTGSNTPSIYWGASIGTQLTGSQAPWDMSAVSDVAAESGKGLSLVHFGTPFASCSSTTTSSCSDEPFPTTPFSNIRAYGAIPFLDWSSVADDSNGTSSAEPSTLAAVIDGTWDSYITGLGAGREGLGPSAVPALRLGDERQLVPVGSTQREPAARLRRGVAARPRHLHLGRRDERDLGVVPERRRPRHVREPRGALPRQRLRRLDLFGWLQLHQLGPVGRYSPALPLVVRLDHAR